MEEDVDSGLGSLLEQLKENNTAVRAVQKIEDPLKKEEMEAFVIKRAGKLVDESLDMIQEVKSFVMAAPEGESVQALAGLIAATSSALETLNKLVVADKKTATSIKLKEMDAQLKRQLVEDNTQSRILVNREEMLRHLAIQAEERKLNSVEVQVLSSST